MVSNLNKRVLVAVLPQSGYSSRLGNLSKITTKSLLSSKQKDYNGTILSNTISQLSQLKSVHNWYDEITLYVVSNPKLHYYKELVKELTSLSGIYPDVTITLISRLTPSVSNMDTVGSALDSILSSGNDKHKNYFASDTNLNLLFLTGDIIFTQGSLVRLLRNRDTSNSLLASSVAKSTDLREESSEYHLLSTKPVDSVSDYLGVFVANPNLVPSSLSDKVSTGVFALTLENTIKEFFEWYRRIRDNKGVEYVDEFIYQFSVNSKSRKIKIIDEGDGALDCDTMSMLLGRYQCSSYDVRVVTLETLHQSMSREDRVVISSKLIKGNYPVVYSNHPMYRGLSIDSSTVSVSSELAEISKFQVKSI